MICHKYPVHLSRLFFAGLVFALSTAFILPAMMAAPLTLDSINPIGDHIIGDRITIGGSTRLAIGDKLWVEVEPSTNYPTTKDQSSFMSKASGTVKVTNGAGTNGMNQWSYEVDTSGWTPDQYTVTVYDTAIDQKGNMWSRATFNLGTVRATVKSTTPSPTISVIPTTVVTNTPTSPISVIATIGSVLIGVTGFIAVRRRR